MKMIRILTLISFVIFAVMVSSGSIFAGGGEPLKIAILVWPGYAHAYVALEKGFFKERGVDVELILEEEYMDMLELYKHGEVDGVFTLLPDVILMNDEGIPARIVCIPDVFLTADGIIGQPELGSLKDLKGRKVSFEGVNSFSHVFVLHALGKEGIGEEDVYFLSVAAKDVTDALDKGEIDAGHTWEPFLSEAKDKGYKVLAYSSGVLPSIIVDVLAFDPRVIEKRPGDVKAVIEALFEAKDFVRSNRKEAIKIMAAALGITEKEMARGVDGIRYTGIEDNKKALERSNEPTSLYASAEIVSRFYSERGQLLAYPDMDDIIEPKFVEDIAAERKKE